jgi:hypothetical protein
VRCAQALGGENLEKMIARVGVRVKWVCSPTHAHISLFHNENFFFLRQK